MDALTYIQIEKLAAEHGLVHDGDYPVTDAGETFSTWRGFTPAGPSEITVRFAGLVTFVTITRYDENIEHEVATETEHGVSAEWILEAWGRVQDAPPATPVLPAIAQTESIAAYINEEHVLEAWQGLEHDVDNAGSDRNYFWKGGLGDEREVFIALQTSGGSAPSLTIDIRVDDEVHEQLAAVSGAFLTGPIAGDLVSETLAALSEREGLNA